MNFKLWVRRLSVSSPTMKIKSNLPWPLRIVLAAVVLGLGGAIAMWTYDLGRRFTGVDSGATEAQLELYKEQITRIRSERDGFSTTVNAAESQLNIERAAKRQLATQVRTLETENIKLKEDLAFFESLLPADTGARGVSIRRLKAEIIEPSQLKYRLLVMQGGKGARDFVGDLQLAVTVLQDGKNVIMLFPEANSTDAAKFKLGFRHYQRIEGVVTLPEGVAIKTVQARILDNGQIRAQHSANL